MKVQPHCFSFKKISQWKDIKIIDIIHYRYKWKCEVKKSSLSGNCYSVFFLSIVKIKVPWYSFLGLNPWNSLFNVPVISMNRKCWQQKVFQCYQFLGVHLNCFLGINVATNSTFLESFLFSQKSCRVKWTL